MFAPRYFASRYFCRRYFPRGSSTAAVEVGAAGTQNRFRSATVPDFSNMDDVRRFMQRMVDEVARAANPIRSVPDGGTGIAALDPGEILAGNVTPDSFARVKGNATTTRKVLVSIGDGTNGGIPFWDEIAAGDIPVAGTGVVAGGVGVVVGGVGVVIP